jgi:hypothetical protein
MTKALPTFVVILFIATIVSWLVISFDHGQAHPTISFTDLEIVLTVTDEGSGVPIPGAEIEIGSLGQDDLIDKKQFPPTNEVGVATFIQPNMYDAKLIGGFGRPIAEIVPPPAWHYRVSAKGYRTTDFIPIDQEKQIGNIQRIDSKRHRLNLSIVLKPALFENKIP